MNSSTCWGARPTKFSGTRPATISSLVRPKAGSAATRSTISLGRALFLDLLAGGDGVLAQALVQLLTVAALFHSLHHNVLAGHEGQLCHQAAAHYLGIDHDAVGDVEHDVQDGIGSQEALGHGNTLVALSSRVRSNHWVPVVKLGFSTSTIR